MTVAGVKPGRGTTRTRICSACKSEKPIADFPKNRTRCDGHGYICSVCERMRKREERRRRKLPHNAEPHEHRPMMGDELFAVYYANADLRIRLCDEARVLARNAREKDEYARDLVQIAWMHIGMCVADQTIDYYASVGLRAMWRDEWKRRYRGEFALESLELMSRAEYDMWSCGHY